MVFFFKFCIKTNNTYGKSPKTQLKTNIDIQNENLKNVSVLNIHIIEINKKSKLKS